MRAPNRSTVLLTAALALGAAACDDGTSVDTPALQEIGVVLNSVDNSLTVFPLEAPDSSFTIGLGGDGTPVGAAVEADRAVVPLGLTPAVAVVDLAEGMVERTIPLPQGSGATGVALFGTDSAIVANPGLNSVSIVDLDGGSADLEITVGVYPAAIVPGGGVAYVLNRNLENFAPAGPGTISVVDLSTLAVVETIELTGTNPGGGVLVGDRLYVLNSGSWGQGDGSLSVVDTGSRTEVGHFTGFGDFPGAIAAGPDGGIHVASFSFGIAVWDPATASFLRGPDNAVLPNGLTTVSAVAFDQEDRLYTLRPFCEPGVPDVAFRLDNDYDVESTLTVGNCPTDIHFTEVEEQP